MIDVESKVKVYDTAHADNGKAAKPAPDILVRSHWNQTALVVLDIDGKRYAVSAADLTAAIRNATNTARHG